MANEYRTPLQVASYLISIQCFEVGRQLSTQLYIQI